MSQTLSVKKYFVTTDHRSPSTLSRIPRPLSLGRACARGAGGVGEAGGKVRVGERESGRKKVNALD